MGSITIPGLPAKVSRVTRTANQLITSANNTNLIVITANSFAQTIDDCATLGTGWSCNVYNAGSGNITVTPFAGQTCDGLSSFIMYPGEERRFTTDNVNLFSEIEQSFYLQATTSQTFTKPPGYKNFDVEGFGPGGPGGSGRRGASGTDRSGGTAGSGGAHKRKLIPASVVGATETITIGASGTPGAAVTTNNTDGNNGTASGNTSFGSLLIAYGGNPGNGGTSGLTTGAQGAGSLSGGGPNDGQAAGSDGSRGFGGAQTNSLSGYPSGEGAGSSGPSMVSVNAGKGGGSAYGGPAGGVGGSITAADALVNPSDGGSQISETGGGAVAGVSSNVAPTAGANGTDLQGGGGSGSSRSVAPPAAGTGGMGAGGGGGGASENGVNSGAGGPGGRGELRIRGIA